MRLLDIDRGGGRREPNNRATVVEAFDGLAALSQNHWPTLALDVGEPERRGSATVSARDSTTKLSCGRGAHGTNSMNR